MSLSQHVFLYCERGTNEALFAEPLNAASNASFLLAALAAFLLLLRRPREMRSADHYPSETISAPVRRGPRGDEVRLPGGTWVPCSFNCYFTLRNATVDFWRRYDVFPQ